MGRAFEYRKATKLKRWGNMARTFTRIGKQIAIAVKAGGPDAENNPHLRAIIATAKRENMPKDNIERAIKNAMGKDQKDYKEMNYEGYGPFGIAIYVETATDNTTRTVANVRSIFNKLGGSLGTSAVKLLLMDEKGTIHHIVSKEYPLYFPRPGWSEQNPEDWMEQTIAGLKELVSGCEKSQVKGISFGGQMHGLVALDAKDRVIRPAILWNDGRTGKQVE